MKHAFNRIGHVSLRTYLALLLCLVLPLFLMFGWIRIQYETYIQQQLSEQIISSISKSEEAVYDSFATWREFPAPLSPTARCWRG